MPMSFDSAPCLVSRAACLHKNRAPLKLEHLLWDSIPQWGCLFEIPNPSEPYHFQIEPPLVLISGWYYYRLQRFLCPYHSRDRLDDQRGSTWRSPCGCLLQPCSTAGKRTNIRHAWHQHSILRTSSPARRKTPTVRRLWRCAIVCSSP